VRSVLDEALVLARAGVPVFPLVANDKQPATSHGFKDATTNEQVIRRWFVYAHNLGLPTGAASGIIVVDCDVDPDKGKDGPKRLRELEDKYGRLPKTRRVRTPRGGQHLYFKAPACRVPCSSDTRIAYGIDVRGDGGYVAAPPSVTTLGSYTVVDETEPAAAPDWLLGLAIGKNLGRPAQAANSTPTPKQAGAGDLAGIDEVRAALFAIDVEKTSEPVWTEIGWALHWWGVKTGNDEAAMHMYAEWSATDGSNGSDGLPRFRPGEIQRKWRMMEVGRPDGITIKSLFRRAYDAGWQGPAYNTFTFSGPVTTADGSSATATTFAANAAPEPPRIITPNELLEFNPLDDPDELIPHRYLCKGSGMLVAGPTGAGKSSWLTQFAIHATVGREVFGMRFVRPLKILIIQAENDRGDMAEMFQGVYRTLEAGAPGVEPLTNAEAVLVMDNLRWIREPSRAGVEFAALLRRVANDNRPDIVVVDPAFAFLGADASRQADVSLWLRNLINPVLVETGIAIVIAHHTNKPVRNLERKDAWRSSDYAYAGSGSIEWANWARCVIALQCTDITGIYRLVAGKRGSRLGWRTADGKPTLDRFIAHAREEGRIYWREPDADETFQIKVVAAVEGFRRLPEVFRSSAEERDGLDADEIMRRAVEMGITRVSGAAFGVRRSQWLTGSRAKAVDHGVLDRRGELFRPKPSPLAASRPPDDEAVADDPDDSSWLLKMTRDLK